MTDLTAYEELDQDVEYDTRSAPIIHRIIQIFNSIKIPLKEMYETSIIETFLYEFQEAEEKKNLDKLDNLLKMMIYYSFLIRQEIQFNNNQYEPHTNYVENKLTEEYDKFDVYGSNFKDSFRKIGSGKTKRKHYKKKSKTYNKRKPKKI
tara:strand:- start:5 stop:451 length:447 start_codon:yes stop_codon:yes gene_type:complete